MNFLYQCNKICPNFFKSKIFMMMRMTLFLSFVLCFSLLATTSYSQNTKMSLDANASTLKTVINLIEEQSDFRFFYNSDLIDLDKVVNGSFRDKTIEEILRSVLDGTSVGYRVLENNFVILSSAEMLQQITISGTVTDENGESLPGVNVVVKGGNTGVVTDSNGKYQINVPNVDAVLIFSFVGYTSTEFVVGNQTSINVQLREDASQIEEVVVVGYGTQKRVNLTGSVVALKGSEVVKSPMVNVTTSLAGRLPGVIINNRTGEPGRENVSLYIRGRSTTGNSDALVLIDGIERGNMGQLNPNDIESISVLKDASAAIYGSRAANGVILITTKRGEISKPTINFSYNQGLSQPTRNPKMADSYTFAKVYNEIEQIEGRGIRYTDDELQKYKDGSDPNYPNTDWYDLMIKKITPQNRANLSVSGGNERVKYYLSLGEVTQQGMYESSTLKYNQINLRSNVDVQVTDNLTVGLNIMGRYEDKHYPLGTLGDLNAHIFLYWPMWQLYWPGTKFLMPNRDTESIVSRINDDAGAQDEQIKNIQNSLFFKWNVPGIKGLSIDGNGSYDYGNTFRKRFNTPYYVYSKDPQTDEFVKRLAGRSPQLANLTNRVEFTSLFYLSAKINYERKFNAHNINAMVGYEQTQIKGNWFQAERSDFLSISIPQLFAGSSDKNKQANDGNASHDAKQNIFGRIGYDYEGKYLVQVTMRIDGSPRFAEGKRFGYFPGVSAGWRISEESFMQDIDFLQNLKIRGSYGKMGNDLVSAFQYLISYRYGNNFVIGNSDVSGLIQDNVPNPLITWETATTWNAGLDATLWKGLLGIEFDVFKTRREDILTRRTVLIPDYTGLSLPDENIGIVDNKGFELTLTHNNQINDIRYRISGNVSFARNKVIFTDEQPAAEPYQMATGRPYGSALYYKANGIFKDQAEVDSKPHLAGAQPGDIIYEDVNGDKELNSRDRIRINQTNIPEIVFGLNFSVEWKGFDLSLFFQGQENAKSYFGGEFPRMSYAQGNFPVWRAKDRWAPDNTTATMPRGASALTNNNSSSSYPSTHWLVNAGFLRLKNAEIGYNLPKNICEKIKIQNLRLFVSGSNLFMIYDHMKDMGLDPEATTFYYYPPQRVYNFGFNISF